MTEQVIGKAVIQAEVDGTGVDAGIAGAKKSLATLGQAAKAAGKEASAAVGGIGTGAGQAAQRIDGATKSVADSLRRIPAAAGDAATATDKLTATQARFLAGVERQAAILTQGRAAYLELKAAQLGVADAAASSIGAIRAADQATHGLGESTNITTQQMQGLIHSVRGVVDMVLAGQSPMRALAIEGGKLSGTFGGVGNAAQAIISLITPMRVVMAGAAAGVVALALAANQGSKELRDFQNAATLTGNAVGLSASGFTQLRDSLVGIAGTKSAAAAALTEIARNGKIAASNVQLVGEAAALMEKATGASISKTIDQFGRLAESPTSAAKELNQQLNFLTTSTFAQIRALEEQGKKAEAADVAERALAEALKSRAAGVVDNVGLMEKAWRSIAGTAKGAWDAMLDVGRTQSFGDQLKKATENLDAARARLQAAGGQFGDTSGGAAVGGLRLGASARARAEADVAASAQQVGILGSDARQEARLAAAEAARAADTKAGIAAVEAASKAAEQYAGKQTKLNDALSDYRENLAKIRALSPDAKDKFGRSLLDPKVIAETETGIRKSFAPDTTGEDGIAQQLAARRVAAEELQRLQASISAMDFSTPTKLTSAEQKVIEIQEQLKGSLQGVARANKERELAAASAAVQDEKDRVATQNQYDAVKKAVEVRQQQIAAVATEATSIRQLATEQAAVNQNYGKSKTAIEEVRLAEIRKQLAEADAFETFDPKYVASVRLKAEAQADYVKQLQQAEFIQKNRSLDEAGRVSAEETATLQLELSLVGRTQLEREKIVAQRKAEVALAKQLAEIDKLNLGDGADAEVKREELRAKARANARVDAENAASKAILNDWQRTADSINQSLTDALLRGFEAGKGFAQNLRDTLKNMFATLVLKPVIQAVLSPVSNSLAGLGQSFGNSLVSSGGSALGGFSNVGSLASLFGSGTSLANTAGTFYANAAGTGLDGLLATNGAFGTAAGGTSAAAGGAGLGALGAAGIAGGILAATILDWKQSKKAGLPGATAIFLPGVGPTTLLAEKLGIIQAPGGPKTESGFGPDVTQRGDPASAQILAAAVQTQYQAIARQFAKNLQVGVFTAQDPQGTALTQLEVAAQLDGASVYNRAARLGGQDKIENVGRSPEELQAAITEESERVVLEALQATNLPDKIGDYLKQLGDIDKLSGGALDAAVQKVQTAMAQREGLEQRLFEATATDAQKLAKTRDAERAATDALNLSLLEQVYRAEDLKKAMDALNGALDSALASYRTSAASGLSRTEAFGQIQTALAISKAGGTLPDVQKLQDAISVLSQPNQDAFRSQADFLSARDSEAALLTALKAQLTSGTVQTPAIVSDAGSTISAAQSTSTALQTIGSLLSDQGVQMQILSDASKTTARVLTDVVNGGASLSVETIA